MLSNLDIVDYVICSPYASSIEIIKALKPKYYLKGEEYRANKNDVAKNLDKEKTICKKIK